MNKRHWGIFINKSEIQRRLWINFYCKIRHTPTTEREAFFSFNRHLLHTKIKKYLKTKRNICAIPTAERKRFISINKSYLCKCRDKRKIKKKSLTAKKQEKCPFRVLSGVTTLNVFFFHLIAYKVEKSKMTRIEGVHDVPVVKTENTVKETICQLDRKSKGNGLIWLRMTTWLVWNNVILALVNWAFWR